MNEDNQQIYRDARQQAISEYESLLPTFEVLRQRLHYLKFAIRGLSGLTGQTMPGFVEAPLEKRVEAHPSQKK